MATSHILYGLSLLNNNLQYFMQLTINLSRAPNHSNNVNSNTIIHCLFKSIFYYEIALYTACSLIQRQCALPGQRRPMLRGWCPFRLTHKIPSHGIPPAKLFYTIRRPYDPIRMRESKLISHAYFNVYSRFFIVLMTHRTSPDLSVCSQLHLRNTVQHLGEL